MSRDAFGFWLERIALSDEPWPRRVQLEVVGFPADAAGQRTHKLAQDDDFELLVHARTDGYEVPDEVEIRFRLADGRRGRDTMIRVGEADSRAATTSSSSATNSSTSPATWTSTSSAATTASAICSCKSSIGRSCSRSSWNAFIPEYLGREPRRLPVTGGMRIPEGTQLALHADVDQAAHRRPHSHGKQSSRTRQLAFPTIGRRTSCAGTTARSPPTTCCWSA